MRDGRRSRRSLHPPQDPDLARALDAMTADELRSFVRDALDRLDHEPRTALVDSLIARAAKGSSGWRPPGPSREIVDEVKRFAREARRVGSADPIEVDGYLRQGTKAFLARGAGKTLFIVLILAFLAMPFHSAAGSETPAGPSPNALFQFQKDNRSHPWLRITADSGMVERKVLRLDPVGLHGMSTPDGVQLPGSMTWSQIQRIDEVVTRAAPWRTAGAVTLGLLGAGLGNALGAPNQQGGRMALAGLLVFGGVGGYLGGEYGLRFRSERNWYVADTARHGEPVDHAEAWAPVSAPGADPAVLSACDRIGRNELFRAYGSFGSFKGYAGIAGPEGLEALRADRHGQRRVADTTLPRLISWDQVDRIEMRGGSAVKGALIGGASFAVLGALVGMAAVAATPGGADVTVAEGGLVGALYVAPVGIVIGGLSGMAARRWVVVYRRP